MQNKLPFHFDMETADPDDSMTLSVLATHPKVHLASVSIHPGGKDQIGFVKRVLQILDREDVRVGAGTPKSSASRVSGFYRDWIGKFEESEADDTAANVMNETLHQFPNCTLLTGAALTNPHSLWETGVFFDRWFCQGGFAGDNIVPKEYRLEKFDGKITCATFNLNGNPLAAEKLLSIPMTERRMISKNVCHAAVFTKKDAEILIPFRNENKGLKLFLKAVELKEKALHDTVAALLAIDPTKAAWAGVIPYRQRGEWGSREVKESSGHNSSLITTHIPDFKDLWMVMKP
jgi:pyrimidine-specific ribonucleoside hydrolase